MNLFDFINNCKEQETKVYRDMVNAITVSYKNADKDMIKNEPWKFWNNIDTNVCADYDVQQTFRKEILGDKNYSNIEKDIDEHMNKLQKSITKVTGNVTDIKQINDTDYLVNGSNANCTIKVTPAKLSSSKNIMKIRLKIVDVEELPELEEKPIQYEESPFVKQWKEKELNGYKTALENWKNNLQKLERDAENWKNTLQKLVQEYLDKNGKLPELIKGEYRDENLHRAAQNRKISQDKYLDYKYNSNRFFYEYGSSADFEERCKKEIDKHFNELQSKVEKRIGRIIEIENLGGDDYSFKGEKGNCVVEVVWAGGYNIQRLHTRWIVKNEF